MKTFLAFATTLFLFTNLASSAHAAIVAQIEPTPEYPRAYEDVTLTLKTYSFDVDLAFITWKVNGQVVKSQIGAKSIKVNAKSTGTVTPIEAKAVLPNGDSVT